MTEVYQYSNEKHTLRLDKIFDQSSPNPSQFVLPSTQKTGLAGLKWNFIAWCFLFPIMYVYHT